MRRSAIVAVLGLLLVAGAGGLYLSGRDEPAAAAPEAAPVATTGELTVEDATRTFLGDSAPVGPAVASEKGVIYAYDQDTSTSYDAPGTLDILAVDVSESSTHVRFSMSAESELRLRLAGYIETTLSGFHTATLVAEQADLSMTGARWIGANELSADCTCGRRPEVVDADGVEVSLLFPALPASVTEVQLKVPGFVPLTAPVNRVGAE
ncbi:hypothetical protein [Kineosporia sp. NBRC 101731]|uniref:hypothetical protein n=1 Tax=Kineosporia sp. NBRC 101731 TaxID=3032199 RepID=UPI0024A1585D|nr:hypothetical protein [Kineosporia sp. NBRC 101731]GLY27098.1 hypothetical protein Kisp02_04630 [Kineosporia sp. NBRC 101731]